jgi:hypothetical protein
MQSSSELVGIGGVLMHAGAFIRAVEMAERGVNQ